MAWTAGRPDRFCRRVGSLAALAALTLGLCGCFPSEPGYYTAVRADDGVLSIVLPPCVGSVSRIEVLQPEGDSMATMWSMTGDIAASGSFDGTSLYALSPQDGASVVGSYSEIFEGPTSTALPEVIEVRITIDYLPFDVQAIISRPSAIEEDSAGGKFVSGDQPVGTLQDLGLTGASKLCR